MFCVYEGLEIIAERGNARSTDRTRAGCALDEFLALTEEDVAVPRALLDSCEALTGTTRSVNRSIVDAAVFLALPGDDARYRDDAVEVGGSYCGVGGIGSSSTSSVCTMTTTRRGASFPLSTTTPSRCRRRSAKQVIRRRSDWRLAQARLDSAVSAIAAASTIRGRRCSMSTCQATRRGGSICRMTTGGTATRTSASSEMAMAPHGTAMPVHSTTGNPETFAVASVDGGVSIGRRWRPHKRGTPWVCSDD